MHIIVLQRSISDLTARTLETILLELPFQNLINTQSYSVTLDLEFEEIDNLRKFALQRIKISLNSKADHVVFNYESLDRFIDQHSTWGI